MSTYDDFEEAMNAPNPPPADGDLKGDYDYSDLSPEELGAVYELQDFSVATRIAALCYKSSIPLPDFTVPPCQWSLSSMVALSCLVSTFGTSNLIDAKIGVVDQSQVDHARSHSVKQLLASFKVPRPASSLLFTQVTLPMEIMKLAGSTYMSAGSYAIIDSPLFNITLKIGQEHGLTNVVLSGGPDACARLSDIRGVIVKYVQVPPTVHYITSLIHTRRSASVVDKKLTFKDVSRIWSPDLLGKPVEMEQFMTRLLDKWCEDLSRANQDSPCPQGMSVKDSPYLSCLGAHMWNNMSGPTHDIITGVCDRYRSNVIEKSKLADLYTLDDKDSAVPYLDWVQIVGGNNGKTITIKQPSGNGINHLATYSAVDEFCEKCRTLRANRDYMRKSDAPGFTGAGESAVSVPAKFAYALENMVSEGVLVRSKLIEAYGVAQKNHWEQFVSNVQVDWGSDLIFKDLISEFRPKGRFDFQVADICNLPPGSGAGKFLFDDTFVVSETLNSQKDRNTRATHPSGPHATHRKLSSILGAQYDAGIVKVVMGSEDANPIRIGHVPRIYQEFRAAYEYVAFFPGSTSHSQEYMLAFGHLPKDVVMKKRKATAVGVLAENMTVQDWLNYTGNWMVAKAADLVRANRYNTIRFLHGVVGGRFVPMHASASLVRPGVLKFRLSGTEPPRGSSLNLLAASVGTEESNNNNAGSVEIDL